MRVWARRLGVAGLLAALLGGAGWIGVDVTVGYIAGDALATRGMECDPIDASFALDLSRVELGPTTCTFERGAIDELRLTGGGHAELDAEQRVTRVVASGLELDLRAEPPHEAIAALVERSEVPEPVQTAMRSLAELAAQPDVPELEVRRIVLRRRTRFVTLRHVTLGREGDAVVLRVAEAAPPPIGRERLRIAGRMAELEVRATRAEVSIAGRLEIVVTLPRRTIEEAIPFALRGAGLDGDAPSFTTELTLPVSLRRIRERQERLAAERAAAAAALPEPPLADRIRELADTLRGTATSMRPEE